MDTKRKMATMSVAQDLVINNPKAIDLDRMYSHGPRGAKTFIDEERGTITRSITLRNNAASTDMVLAFGNLANSIYADIDEAAAALSIDKMVTDGTIATVETDKTITGASNDAGFTIAQLVKYIGMNPTRIVSVRMESTNLSGSDDTTNYAQSIKTAWVSPFVKPIEENLDLARFASVDRFQKRYMNVNFLKEGFPVILSAEHFFAITLKRSTILNLTFEIGFQDSAAQRFYRQIKKADSTLGALRK